jgi:UDP-glucose 4-epimerase
VGSGHAELQLETEYLSQLLGGLVRSMRPRQLALGQFFLASSAGGIYAGARGAPYTEQSEERPLAPYGFNKLQQESIVRRWSVDTGAPALIGRLSNIYGPGQNLSKGQGLISQVCRTVILHQTFVLYTSPDTLRDYLYVNDAGDLVADGLDRLREEHAAGARPSVVTKILASGQACTIATILGEVRRIAKCPVRVVMAASPSSRYQASDLRMNSVEWRELDRRSKTTLSAGIRMVMNYILHGLQQGRLPHS